MTKFVTCLFLLCLIQLLTCSNINRSFLESKLIETNSTKETKDICQITNEKQCEDHAEFLRMPFYAIEYAYGAPAGCILYENGHRNTGNQQPLVYWVKECNDHANCNTDKCGDKFQDCKVERKMSSQECEKLKVVEVDEFAGCSQKLCTSPNARGGYDCWAGNGEAYTCGKGYSSRMTGKTAPYKGKTYLGYTCCKAKVEKITPDCTEKKCTSPNGRGGMDCWAGNGEAYSCLPGYSSRMTGKTVPWAGKTYLGYTCCKAQIEKITPDCSQKLCTSPNGKGGVDCWAGNGEEFTCKKGYSSRLTGKSGPYGGKTWINYTCCKDEEKVKVIAKAKTNELTNKHKTCSWWAFLKESSCEGKHKTWMAENCQKSCAAYFEK